MPFGGGLVESLLAKLAEMADRSGLSLARLLYIQDSLREAMYKLGVGRKGVGGRTLTLEALFRTYDDDQTGRVDLRELERALRSDMDIDPGDITLEEVKQLYVALDRDGSGSIDPAELVDFVQITPSAVRVIGHKIVAAAYTSAGIDLDSLLARADRDSSGSLDFDEFRRFVRVTAKQSPARVPDLDLKVLFDFLDVDSSGSMSIEELATFLHGEAAVEVGGPSSGAAGGGPTAARAAEKRAALQAKGFAFLTQKHADAAAGRGRVASWSGSKVHERLMARIHAAASRSGLAPERLEAVQDLMREAVYRVGLGSDSWGGKKRTSIRSLFKLYDDDDTGVLDVRELARAVRHDMMLGPDVVTYAEIEGLLSALDLDGSGTVGVNELANFISITPGGLRTSSRSLPFSALVPLTYNSQFGAIRNLQQPPARLPPKVIM
ncbi:hypothetical protein T492DRAFT_841525 [Pavlovales sp. CCMP2436]|nr:hypothetical protein T492DRAFT_841525 [Pavlovales sp. CCMP2436]